MSDAALNLRLAGGLLWALAATGATVALLRRPRVHLPGGAWLLAAALVIRLLPAFLLPRGAAYEMDVFQRGGAAFLAGENVYAGDIAHPYLPLFIYWNAAANRLAAGAGLFYVFWHKLPAILADAALAVVVSLAVSRRHGATAGRHAGWLYALNPVTLLVTAYQGQFDAVPLLFIMLAWYLLSDGRRRTAAALCLGVATLAKTWPLLFLPVAWRQLSTWRRRIAFAAVVALIPLLGVVLYETLFPGSVSPIARRALRAGAIPGWWGYSAVLNVYQTVAGRPLALYTAITAYGRYLPLAAFGLALWLARRRPPLVAWLLALLTFYVAAPNLGLQSLSWVVAPALVAGHLRPFAWFLAGVVFHMVVAYWGLHLHPTFYRLLPRVTADIILQLSSLPAWAAVLAWLAAAARGRARLAPVP